MIRYVPISWESAWKVLCITILYNHVICRNNNLLDQCGRWDRFRLEGCNIMCRVPWKDYSCIPLLHSFVELGDFARSWMNKVVKYPPQMFRLEIVFVHVQIFSPQRGDIWRCLSLETAVISDIQSRDWNKDRVLYRKDFRKKKYSNNILLSKSNLQKNVINRQN